MKSIYARHKELVIPNKLKNPKNLFSESRFFQLLMQTKVQS